jgi:hypothetical protein
MRPWSRLVLLICLIVSGCASTQLPLCPKIAAVSFPSGVPVSAVNRYISEDAARRGIKIAQLSPFVAEYRGSVSAISAFESNYRFLVCAFEPSQERDPRAAYMTCTAHSPFWIDAIKSDAPQNLMLQEHLYFERCVM